MSDDIRIPNHNELKEQVLEKKSKKKKKIAVVSTIIILIPVILAVIYTMNPTESIINRITVDDFPLEKFSEGLDVLCNRDELLSCVVKNDGRIDLTLENGIYKFQTVDYSLIKGYYSDIGYEEKSISYAFYADQVEIRSNNREGYQIWLVTAKGMQ